MVGTVDGRTILCHQVPLHCVSVQLGWFMFLKQSIDVEFLMCLLLLFLVYMCVLIDCVCACRSISFPPSPLPFTVGVPRHALQTDERISHCGVDVLHRTRSVAPRQKGALAALCFMGSRLLLGSYVLMLASTKFSFLPASLLPCRL